MWRGISTDADCQNGLVCGTNKCKGRVYDSTDDCCVRSKYKKYLRPVKAWCVFFTMLHFFILVFDLGQRNFGQSR